MIEGGNDSSVGTATSMGRRTALRMISAAFAIAGVFGLNAGPVYGQLEVELIKRAKDKAKAFARVRKEWGLKPAEPSGPQLPPAVGEELTEGLQSFDEVLEALTARIRRPMKLIDSRTYSRKERVRLKHVLLDAETRMRRTVDALARNELSLLEARAAVRRAFADYLEELEAAPRR